MMNNDVFRPVFLVAFSGHRPSEGPGRSRAELEAMRPAITAALLDLQQRAARHEGTIEIYSSIAAGTDTIACEAARDLGLPVHLILPKPEPLFAQDFAGHPEDWERARSFIDAARAGTGGATLRVARGSHVSPDCYSETNVQMLEGADAVIVVHNGLHSGKPGGTGHLLRQTKALRLPLVALNPLTGAREDFHLERFASPAERVSGLAVMEGLFHRAGGSPGTTFARTHDALNEAADRSSKWFRLSLVLAIILHGVAAIVAAVAVSFQDNITRAFGPPGLPVIAGLELLLVSLALGFMLRHHRRGTQRIWLHCRFATELLRSIRSTSGILDPLHPQSKHHPPQWHRFVLSATLALRREIPPPGVFETLKDNYLRGRIDDQLAYFRAKLARATPLAHGFGKVASLSAWAAVLAVLGAFLYKLSHLGHPDPAGPDPHAVSAAAPSLLVGFFVFLLPIALPLLAGMATSLQTSLDVGRRRIRYREMVDTLEGARPWIEQLETPVNLTIAASRIESVLLDEHIEWMAAAESGQGH